jgi:hypothetical protein
MKLFISTAILGAALSTTALAEGTVSNAMQDAKTKVFEAFHKESLTIDFSSGSAEISASEQKDLAALIQAAKNDGAIKQVVVASWSDSEYPATKGEELSKAARDLADARNANLSKAIKALGVTSVETYAMTAQPNWIQKTFNTDAAKVKGDGEVKDAEEHLATQIGKTLRDKGGPGKAVVLIRREGDFTAH